MWHKTIALDVSSHLKANFLMNCYLYRWNADSEEYSFGLNGERRFIAYEGGNS